MRPKWKLGEYIAMLMAQKNWTASRLAKESGLSHVYVGWVVNGETSDKANPPKISLETLMALSKALGVSEEKLILAYKGKNPDGETLGEADEYGLSLLKKHDREMILGIINSLSKKVEGDGS